MIQNQANQIEHITTDSSDLERSVHGEDVYGDNIGANSEEEDRVDLK